MPPDADDFSIFEQVRATASRRIRLRLGLPSTLHQAVPLEIALVAPAWLLLCPTREAPQWPAVGFGAAALAMNAAALVFFRRMGSRPLEIGWRILLFAHLLRLLNNIAAIPKLPPGVIPGLAAALSIVGASGLLWGLRLDRLRRSADIERLKRAVADRRNAHRRFVDFVDTVDGVVWEALAEPFELQFVSRRAGVLLGFAPEIWLQQRDLWADRIHPDDRERVLHQIADARRKKEGYRLEYRMISADGRTVWVRDLVNVVEDLDGQLKLRGVTVDVTESKQLEDRLRHTAHHDALTGLPNRPAFTEALDRAARKAPAGSVFAVFFLDLDRFKIVNDTFGHLAGDAVLNEAAARILRAVRSRDVVARFGGDEFAILAENLRSPDEAVELAARLRQEINRPVEVEGRQFALSASIGIKVAASGSAFPQDILRDADTAMYCAKETACGSQQLFEQAMRDRLMAQLPFEREPPSPAGRHSSRASWSG
jgi:diguanylate cyclase (GGDEF)-like protein/PAS domain S-box-containing protein